MTKKQWRQLQKDENACYSFECKKCKRRFGTFKKKGYVKCPYCGHHNRVLRPR